MRCFHLNRGSKTPMRSCPCKFTNVWLPINSTDKNNNHLLWCQNTLPSTFWFLRPKTHQSSKPTALTANNKKNSNSLHCLRLNTCLQVLWSTAASNHWAGIAPNAINRLKTLLTYLMIISIHLYFFSRKTQIQWMVFHKNLAPHNLLNKNTRFMKTLQHNLINHDSPTVTR